MKKSAIIGVLSVLALLLNSVLTVRTAAATDDPPTHAPFSILNIQNSMAVPYESGKIAFATDHYPNYPDNEIWVMNSDGSGKVRLTHNSKADGLPTWSPDGRKVAFIENVPPAPGGSTWGYDIFSVNADGSNLTRLTYFSSSFSTIKWSPDGRKIAFASGSGLPGAIWVMNSDGTDPMPLDTGDSPTWSPDGSKLMYSAYHNGYTYLYVMDADGGNKTQVSPGYFFGHFLDWSPDGNKVVFRDETYGLQIYVMNSDGSNPTRLTYSTGYNNYPAWSPDGTHIAFASSRDGNQEIYVMKADGSEQTNVTNTYFDETAPSWSLGTLAMPTSTTLVSSSNPSAQGEPVAFTAYVTALPPAAGIPTGTVTFKDGTAVLGTATLNASGSATYITYSLSKGGHSITAAYGGDASFADSTSAVLNQNTWRYGDAKGVWEVVRPSLQSAAAASFIDPQQGWITNGRTVSYTNDGGTTWTKRDAHLDANIYLLDIDFVDATYGWVSGTDGTLLHTVDGGATWSAQSAPLNNVTAVDFADRDNGWALDDSALAHSVDGGMTWTSQPVSGGIRDLLFLDRLHGWVVGDTFVLRTSDGGLTWQETDMPALIGGVSFVDSLNGWLVGYGGRIWRTRDGGASWTNQPSGTSFSLLDVSFTDQNRGWAVGFGSAIGVEGFLMFAGIILGTTDGGNTWLKQANFSSEHMQRVTALDNLNAYVMGGSGSILRTADAGLTWIHQANGVSTQLGVVEFIDDDNGWAGGLEGTIMHTTDGGANWKPQESNSLGLDICGISFADANHGWAAAANAWFDLGAVLHTSDGGATWSRQIFSSDTQFFDVAAIDAQSAWAAGNGGVLLHTTDGGATWDQLDLGLQRAVNRVGFVDKLHGWVLAGEYVLRTSNGGISWETFKRESDFWPTGAVFISDSTAWILGDFVAIRTTDGGKTWSQRVSSALGLRGIDFADERAGWIVGLWGTVLHTDDGGDTWSSEEINLDGYADMTYDAFAFRSATDGLAFGSGGAILRYSPVSWDTYTISLQAGWNMVSAPLKLSNSATSAVFPGAAVFAWDPATRSYFVPATIEPSKGYWVAVAQDMDVTLSGTPVTACNADLKAGWNIVGSVSANASLVSPNDNPDGSVMPTLYWWNPATKTYEAASSIEPGKGYWLPALQDCSLALP